MIKRIFLDTASVVTEALGLPTIASHWDDQSALSGYKVGALAGHTARAITTPLVYLARPAPSGHPVGPAEYFAKSLRDLDPIDSPEHVSVRMRGETEAEAGRDALIEGLDIALIELHDVFESLEQARLVSVFSETCMTVDDYLVTRIVEMVIHLDDLGCSVDDPLPSPPGDAIDLTLATVVEIAAIRHGHTALLRAFTRRERVDQYPYAF